MRHKITRLLAQLLLIVGIVAAFSATAQAAITLTSGNGTGKPTVSQGITYNNSPYFAATGGVAPYSYSTVITGGPAAADWNGGGFVFNSDGTLSGRSCIANGNVTYTVTVTDANGQTAVINAANSVKAAPNNVCATLTMNSLSPITGTVGTAITPQTNVAAGGTGPYTYDAAGLPAGLSIDHNSGTVTGTPTGPTGSGTYTVTATDVNGNTITKTISYTINAGAQAPLTVQISANSSGTIPGTATLSTTGGSGNGAVTYTVVSGTCTVSGNILTSTANGTCVISATKAADTNGLYSATTSTNTVSFTTNTALTPVDPPITLGPSTTIPSGGSQVVTVAGLPAGGGAPPYANAATGTIDFTVSGPCTVSPAQVTLPALSTTVTSTGPAGSCVVTANYSGDVNYLPSTGSATETVAAAPADALVLGPPAGALTGAQVGLPYAQIFTATGGTGDYTYSVASGALPPNMTLNPTTGRLSGVPTTEGTYNFRICVTDSAMPTPVQDCKNYSLTVAGGFGITTNSLPAPTLGSNYSQPIQVKDALGAVTYAITAGALPAGLALDTTTGVITGIPQTGGCYNFTVTATDSGRLSPYNTSSKAYSFCIARPDPSKDVNVRGIISSQARAAYRFVRGQIALIQSHLDSMHDDDDSGDGCSDPDRPSAVQDFCVEYDNKLQINGAQRPLSGQEQDVQNLRRLNDVNALADPTGQNQTQNQNQRLTQNQIQGQPKVGSVESLLGNTQDGKLASDPTVREFFALGAERSSNYPPRTAGQTAEVVGPTPKIKGGVKVNVWTAGQIDFGRYDNQGRLLNEKFNVGSIAVGADARIIPGLRAGVAFGYGNDYATINYGLAQSTAQNFSGTAYASYRVMPGLFLDALAGYGDLNYTSSRLAANSRDWITGNRSGYAFYESLALTMEKRYGALKLAPYLRVDGAQVNLNRYSEVGNYDWALTYANAMSTTVDAVAGVRASYDYKLINGGVITPNVRAQFQKFFTGSLNQFMNYSIDPTMNYGYFDQGQLQWMFMGTIGAQYTVGNISAGVDYITTTSGARYQTNGMRGNIRVSF